MSINSEPADPLNVLSQLNELIEQNNDEDICVICQDVLDNGEDHIFYLPECSHGYHTNCIMTWFRSGNQACPCCGNKGSNTIINENYYRRHRGPFRSRFTRKGGRFSLLKKMLKSKDCPNGLRLLFDKYDKTINEIDELEKNKRNGRELCENMIFKEAQVLIKSMNEKLFRRRQTTLDILRQINEYPVVPLIIPIKKKV